MENYSLFKFAVKRESEVDSNKVIRVYQFEISPGSPFEEIFSALDEIKVGFEQIKQEAKDREDKANAEKAALEPEIVS